MDFELDDQQRALRDEARRFLEGEASLAAARAAVDTGEPNSKLWRQMTELGWAALPFDEEYGGLGLGFIAVAILAHEMGRMILPGPFLATVVLGGLAIDAAGNDEQRARLLPGIASGTTTATLAIDGTVEHRDGRLDGTHRFVIDGADADVVIVRAHDADGSPALFVAEPRARTPVATLDATRPVADLTFDGSDCERLERSSLDLIERVTDRASVALAAEMLGGAEAVLDLATAYAGEREQFGRPIGSFQAVKHTLADAKVRVESLRNAVLYAAWAIERDHPEAGLAASTAKAYASEAGPAVARAGIQVHGGIGFTWEHDMHLFLKRALFNERAFGDAAFHQERIASVLGARA